MITHVLHAVPAPSKLILNLPQMKGFLLLMADLGWSYKSRGETLTLTHSEAATTPLVLKFDVMEQVYKYTPSRKALKA